MDIQFGEVPSVVEHSKSPQSLNRSTSTINATSPRRPQKWFSWKNRGGRLKFLYFILIILFYFIVQVAAGLFVGWRQAIFRKRCSGGYQLRFYSVLDMFSFQTCNKHRRCTHNLCSVFVFSGWLKSRLSSDHRIDMGFQRRNGCDGKSWDPGGSPYVSRNSSPRSGAEAVREARSLNNIRTSKLVCQKTDFDFCCFFFTRFSWYHSQPEIF